MVIEPPYLIFLGDVPDALAAKTGLGIVDWRPEWCIGQLRLEGCKADAGIPDLSDRRGQGKRRADHGCRFGQCRRCAA